MSGASCILMCTLEELKKNSVYEAQFMIPWEEMDNIRYFKKYQ